MLTGTLAPSCPLPRSGVSPMTTATIARSRIVDPARSLPYELVGQLLAALGDRLEWAVIRQPCIGKAEAQAADRRSARSCRSVERGRRRGRSSVSSAIGSLRAILVREDLVEFLRDGEVALAQAGLALLGDQGLLRVRGDHGMNKRGLPPCARAQARGATLPCHAHGPGPGRAGTRERRPRARTPPRRSPSFRQYDRIGRPGADVALVRQLSGAARQRHRYGRSGF